jgi:hypothetical protein
MHKEKQRSILADRNGFEDKLTNLTSFGTPEPKRYGE